MAYAVAPVPARASQWHAHPAAFVSALAHDGRGVVILHLRLLVQVLAVASVLLQRAAAGRTGDVCYRNTK